ncbi:MAG: hypothetical protein MRZ79_00995 [Bacteroidia bacterium]|nr:hypothetical protein [Bacteroidia bacterium]
MKYFWNFLASFILLSSLTLNLNAQTVYIDYTDDEGLTAVCAWESARMFKQPGDPDLVGTVLFGEEVTHLGQEALVKEEKRNYLLVKTKEGKIGWVNEVFLVKDAGLVVVLEKSRLYENQASFSSAKDDFILAGELAILNNYQDDWVFLIGKEKQKSGWIKGKNILSVDSEDISVASMLDKARSRKNSDDQLAALSRIGQTRGFGESRLAPIVREEIRRIQLGEKERENFFREEDEFRENGEDDLAVDIWNSGDSRGRNRNELNRLDRLSDPNNIVKESQNYKLERQEVVDFNTNRTLIRYRETGTIAPVRAKNPPSIYYAYHKELPKGSKVLLEVPGTDKYVELTIIAPLKKTNPNMIGMGSGLLKAVYGESQAKNVPSATILYYKE